MSENHVLRMYRNMMRLARCMEGPQRAQTVTRLREEFRRNRGEQSQERVAELLKKAESSLGYMRIVTPKSKLRQPRQQYATKVMIIDNEVVTDLEVQNKARMRQAHTNWDGKNLDPDAVKRHYTSLKRAGFRDNAHAKGFF